MAGESGLLEVVGEPVVEKGGREFGGAKDGVKVAKVDQASRKAFLVY